MSSPTSILLADDEASFRESTAGLLRDDGYHCDTAVDAKSALQKIEEAQYDVLLSDIKMPGNDQLELIRRVREVAYGLPVILITGYPSTHTAIQSIKLPVVEYLTKPFEYEELVAAIGTAIATCNSYGMIKQSEKRVDNWHKELLNIKEKMTKKSSPLAVDTFYALTMSNIIGSLEDLQNISASLATRDSTQSACNMLDCPRITTLVDTLRNAIEVLEKTRTSFKSKELHQLRKQIEKVMRSVAVGETQK
ncbi:MAG: response regulator [Proteobacteria bacterium]|nr:response regulator [Pseudomonadota bacterium]